jgi:coproporphyrinogen III oxidase
MISSDLRKKMADRWFSYLQIQICKSFEFLEENKFKFSKRNWQKEKIKEGGGASYLLTGGKIFDKVGVNKSTVTGTFPKKFRSKIFGASKNGKYWASGVSVVAHMKNPKIPAIHFNTRFIVTSKEWFGGGMDATPSHADHIESKIIHNELKKVCLQNKKNYKKYKKWCDEYFYLPHRKEARGIGGIFFDYETKDWIKTFKFIRDLGLTFIDISNKVINRKKKLKYTIEDK